MPYIKTLKFTGNYQHQHKVKGGTATLHFQGYNCIITLWIQIDTVHNTELSERSFTNKAAVTLYLQWSISDQCKQHVLVFNEFLPAVNRSVHEFLIITKDVHDTIDHTQSVPSWRWDVSGKRIGAHSWRIGWIICNIVSTSHIRLQSIGKLSQWTKLNLLLILVVVAVLVVLVLELISWQTSSWY